MQIDIRSKFHANINHIQCIFVISRITNLVFQEYIAHVYILSILSLQQPLMTNDMCECKTLLPEHKWPTNEKSKCEKIMDTCNIFSIIYIIVKSVYDCFQEE